MPKGKSWRKIVFYSLDLLDQIGFVERALVKVQDSFINFNYAEFGPMYLCMDGSWLLIIERIIITQEKF